MNARAEQNGHQERLIRQPTRLQAQVRNVLRRTHLLCLTVIAIYIAYHYEGSAGIVAMLLAAGYIAETSPIAWRKRYFCEILFVGIGLATFFWARTIDAGLDLEDGFATDYAFGGWLRMLLAYYVLIPARFGMLRHIAALVATELLVAGHRGDGFWSYLVLLPGVLACLVLDNWTQSMHNPVGRQVAISSTAPRLKLGLLAGVITCSLLAVLLFGNGVILLTAPEVERTPGVFGPRDDGRAEHLSRELDPHDEVWTSRSTQLVARLRTSGPPGVDQHYLRVLYVPRIQIDPEHGTITWTSRARADRRLPDEPVLHAGHEPIESQLYRSRGNPGVVFVPDGCSWVGLSGIRADIDGNLFREGLGELFPVRYPVDAGIYDYPAPEWTRLDRAELLYVPSRVAFRLNQEIGNIERWRQLPAIRAKAEITAFLRARCRYKLEDRPPPFSGEGGGLLRFLLGEEDNRRGHCQFFSTAAVILLRLAGHPARPVVGFASDHVDPEGVTFRELHAHAWAEVLDDRNHWLRLDPTPPTHRAIRQEGFAFDEDFKQLEREALTTAEDTSDGDDTTNWRPGLLIPLGAGFLLVTSGLLIFLHHRRRRPDPHQRALTRRAEDLVSTAVALGIRVEQSDTIATIVGRIEECITYDLGPYLHDYHTSRFGRGEVPPPWPIREIRRRAREQRRAAGHRDAPAT